MKDLQPSDKSLLSRLRRGDRTVLDAMYHKYACHLWLYMGEVESQQDGEELIADALQMVWDDRENLRSGLKGCVVAALLTAMNNDGRWEWGRRCGSAKTP